jgi:hypothetical protein
VYFAGMYNLIVVGGGAAGFFGAIQAAEQKPGMKILILEKTSRVLAKVRISGGGRCNVTHHEFNAGKLAQHYPRGEKALKQLFRRFQAKDVVTWFESKGVKLKVEDDGRMFPATDSSSTIINCFLQEAQRHHIEIELNEEVIRLEKANQSPVVVTSAGKNINTQQVLVAMGGHANPKAYQWLKDAGHTITPTVPSLFTLNDPSRRYKHLMGVSVPDASVKITGTKFSSRGPILITHWGLSGPAVIRLSAWAALYLAEKHYDFQIMINWLGDISEEDVRLKLMHLKSSSPKQKVCGHAQFELPQRLWLTLCEEAGIDASKLWGELSHKIINRLLEFLIRCPFHIQGKTTFKEEFVTCGGVEMSEINLSSMESKIIPHVYFAGEVLNIDGETGGFNFQAAWTTAWVAAQDIANKTA